MKLIKERMVKMKKLRHGMLVVFSFLLIALMAMSAWGCTDIVVGKDASADGSVITSHTADGAFYDASALFLVRLSQQEAR